MRIVSKNVHTKLLRFQSGCHGMKIGLVSNRNIASAARDLVPTSKKTFTFYKGPVKLIKRVKIAHSFLQSV